MSSRSRRGGVEINQGHGQVVPEHEVAGGKIVVADDFDANLGVGGSQVGAQVMEAFG
jgi:hypothetical protein